MNGKTTESTWTPKKDHQYEHIVQVEMDRGHTLKQAHAIADKVVNQREVQTK